VSRLFRSQYVVDIEDVIAVLVVIAIVLDALARLGQDSTWVAGGLVIEAGVTQLVRRGQMACKRLKWLGLLVSTAPSTD
jgi:hypothetical protein